MRGLSHIIVIFLGALLVSCSAPTAPQTVSPESGAESETAPTTSEPGTPTQRTLVVLGDSLSAGFGLSVDEALPARLEENLVQLGLDIKVINAGVSGDTTANGLARYDWSVASAAPDYLIIALGANDYLMDLSPVAARANLANIIERAQADGIAVILAGLDPRSETAAPGRETAFATIYPDLATQYNLPLYPALLAGVRDAPEYLQSDGLHPNAEGVTLMADQLAVFLAPRLSIDGD